jgi:hypothetical protein
MSTDDMSLEKYNFVGAFFLLKDITKKLTIYIPVFLAVLKSCGKFFMIHLS